MFSYLVLPSGGTFLLTKRRDSKGRPRRSLGKNCPVDTFLVRGRIPGFPNAVRRTVGGKANAIKLSPIRGHFFVNEEVGFERATQAQPGEKLSGGHLFF